MTLKLLDYLFSVCQLEDMDAVDLSRPFTFLSRTDDELSLVCPTPCCPPNPLKAEHGWQCLKVEGVLDFGMVGVIARLSGALAEARIPLFVISTFNTDYVLLKADKLEATLDILRGKGYEIWGGKA